MQYRIVEIPKGNGGHRKLYIPSKDLKTRLRLFLPLLHQILESHDDSKSNYAFQTGRNCAMNALQHAGYRYNLAFDLQDFFGSVKASHVTGVLPEWLIQECFIDGAPQQGLPTSPLVATIAFLPYDKLILRNLQRLNLVVVYTRYADDMVFSFDDPKTEGKLRTIVKQVVEQGGFKLNTRKTRLQDARNGRIVITGIGVDSLGLHPTRRTKKKLRAALNQGNLSSAMGLVEWSRCKLPALK